MNANLQFQRLTPDHVMRPFDCGDKDLNEFCLVDSYHYQKQLLSVTYYSENKEDTILFFSLSNDKLSASETTTSFWKRLKHTLPRDKHRKDYPAVKIGRLAVNKKYRGNGQHLGTVIIEYIKRWMVTGNKTGCRFITVDAYHASVEFYKRCGFVFAGGEEEKRYLKNLRERETTQTYAMYFDLSVFIDE